MKKIPLMLMVTACGMLANCKSTVAMGSGELATVMKESPFGAKRVSVSVEIKSPGEKAVSFPAKTVRAGEDFSISSTREFVYPAGYELPSVSDTGVEPATPTHFETVNTGITMSLKTEKKGLLVVIGGKVDVVSFDHFIRMGGELGKPITDDRGKMISENRMEMPAIRTFMTPVYVAAKPGTPISFEIDHPKKGTRMTVMVKAVN